MTYISPAEANAWLESTKLSLSSIEPALESQIAVQVKAQLNPVFDTSAWTNEGNTPALIRSIIAMMYVAAIYERAYSNDTPDDQNNYSGLLRGMAAANIRALLDGNAILAEDPEANVHTGTPAFYPNDLSSNPDLADASIDPSAGPPAFTMGTVW